jgi:hypothetical protein
MQDHFDGECRVIFLDDILIISCLLQQSRDGSSRVHGVELVGGRLGCCTAPIGIATEFFRNYATLYNKVLHLSKYSIAKTAKLHLSLKKTVMLPTSREGFGPHAASLPWPNYWISQIIYHIVPCKFKPRRVESPS